MATTKNPSLKDPQLYAELRDDGASKQKAARISNAADIGLKGYSTQRKAALIESLRNS